MFDPQKAKTDFPIFRANPQDQTLVYLDNAATSQKPQVVLDALLNFYLQDNANVHRGIYQLSERASQAYESARRVVADFFHVKKEEIIFTRNTTEGLNLLATSLAKNIQAGEEILVSDVEHHSNFLPWQRLATERNAKFVILPSENGKFSWAQFAKYFNSKTKIVALPQMSNVTGFAFPIQEIAKKVHQQPSLLVIDGAQGVAHLPTDFTQLGCDAYAFSGHKVFGPMGIGALFVKNELLENLEPYQLGGGMIENVTPEKSTFLSGPEKFEAGTPNVAGAIGLAAALQYLQEFSMQEIAAYEEKMIEVLKQGLLKIPGIHLVGDWEGTRHGVISFYHQSIHAHDLAALLDKKGIAIRAGFHCAMPFHQLHQLPATARVSLALYTQEEEIAFFLENVAEIVRKYQK
jgi:cysteine desulfurase/selenocysteine lyase